MEQFNVFKAQQVEWSEDQVSIDELESKKLHDHMMEKGFEISEIIAVDMLYKKLDKINKGVEDLLDVTFFDRWEIDADDGSLEERKSVDLIVEKLNDMLNTFIVQEKKGVDKLFTDLDLWKYSSEIKTMIENLEKRKGWYHALNHILDRNRRYAQALDDMKFNWTNPYRAATSGVQR